MNQANFGDHPWTALVMDTNNQVIYGLGIVISWRIVLTTARNVQHLQRWEDLRDYLIFSGDDN